MANQNFQYDVFLSHSSKDKLAVRQLAERLQGDGLRVWFDEWVIKLGDDIYQAIENGLENSRAQILFMSSNAFAAEWVSLERNTALFRDPTNRNRRFIPLLLKDCKIPDTVRRFKYVDFREESDSAYKALLAACKPDAVPLGIVSPESPPKQSPPTQTRTAFTDHVRQQIGKLLERQKLRSLSSILLERLPEESRQHAKPEDALIPLQGEWSAESSIGTLHVAVRVCLQQLSDQDPKAIPDFNNEVIVVLGWLVLLAVSEDWLRSDPERHKKLKNQCVEIPIKSEAAIEVVIARLHEHPAQYRPLPEEGSRVDGANRIILGDDLERGFDQADSLKELKKQIALAIRSGYKSGELFDEVAEEELRTTLEIRNGDGEHYYIAIPAIRYPSGVGDETLLIRLSRDLPYLGAFLTGVEESHPVLVIGEGSLVARIQGFFRMLGQFS